MANWRKNQGINNHQVGQWRSSSFNGKPPLGYRFPTVPLWEKKFCASVGLVPWRRVIEGKKYIDMHPKVMEWEDSAVKEAFHDARFRFWGEINGFPCSIPLPDPNMFIDDVDWDACVDHELYLDLDREVEARRNVKERGLESLIIDGYTLLLKDSFDLGWGLKPTGWDDEEVTKPPEPSHAADGRGSSNHQNIETNSWEENEYPRWIPMEHYGGDLQDKYQARNLGAWEGHSKRRENNVSWFNNPTYDHGNNVYEMNRGRRNGARGRRENYTYVAKVRNGARGGGGRRENYIYVAKVTPGAWKNSLDNKFGNKL